MVKIVPNGQNGLFKASAADCFQIKSLSVARFLARIGSVEPEIIIQVQAAVSQIIGAL